MHTQTEQSDIFVENIYSKKIKNKNNENKPRRT